MGSQVEMKIERRHTVFAFFLLVLATLACNRTVPTATPGDTPLPPTPSSGDETPITPTGAPSSSGTPTATAVPASTPSATPITGTPECVYDADFVTDVTIPDDTELEPGAEFAKTWRMRNNGTCAWEPGTQWAFESGEKMDGPDQVSAAVTQPGETTDITVHLTAPDEPGAYTGLWRMRAPDGGGFGTRAFVQIVVVSDQPTSTPTSTPTATPTSQPGVGPTIELFRSDLSETDPGDTITLEWETRDATSATLYHLMPTGQLGSFWEVNVDGRFEYDIDPQERNHSDFLLIVSDDQGRTARASVSIRLRCPDTWFFEPAPDECPASAAITSAGAEQHFQHGVMIWVQAQDVIYVLYDDGNSPWWSIFSDEWDEGEPERDPDLTPPADLYQPVRGFGRVWREIQGLRDRLGWATDPEAAFDTAVQRTSRAKYNDTYIRALDGKVWRLLPEASGWEKVSE
jgi:hypothetical protein